MRLVVTGASGLLGLNLSLVAQARGDRVMGLVNSRLIKGVPFDVAQADLLETRHAVAVIEAARPEAIIHCAAVANINAAEETPDLAYQLNGEVPGLLAAAAARWGIPFIHISTDAVFDGKMGGYHETDLVNPLSVYARTKLAGEQAVLAAYPDAVVARVVFYGWSLSGQRSLSEFFYRHLKDKIPIKGFSDTYFCPLYVEDLADYLLTVLDAGLHGVYHVVSTESLSKYDFGVRIAKKFGYDPGLITPVRMADISRRAARSQNLTLRPDKLEAALGRPMPTIESGIDRLYQRWRGGYPARLQAYQAAAA